MKRLTFLPIVVAVALLAAVTTFAAPPDKDTLAADEIYPLIDCPS